ncbi:MAG: hypothetical protein WBB45_18995 [Cyclobacteriaceae bacterium]
MRVIIVVEERGGKAGRAYGKIIDDFGTESLKPIMLLILILRLLPN